MDFSLASKHQRDVVKRRQAATRRVEEQRRADQFKVEMERDLRERELRRLQKESQERAQLEEEVRLNGGVEWRSSLRPFPSDRTDDKLTLPPSVLESLSQKGAFENGMLTFAVTLPGTNSRTHAGVAEFVAEEGTVGIPPRVALCLTKDAGLESLALIPEVEVRFARLPHSSKCTVTLQPRGQGFHADGINAVRMDLEHVLMESLRGHTALTKGDWLPIRNAGVTYELIVRDLEPEAHVSLIDTELAVDLLPSEQTEVEEQAELTRQAEETSRTTAAKEKESARLARAQAKAANLADEPPPCAEAIHVLLRLPQGNRLQRRFLRSSRLQTLLDWVESESSTLVSAPGAFRIVQKWPGHARELGLEEAGETLADLKFARQEALFIQHLEGLDDERSGEVDQDAEHKGAPSVVTSSLVPFRLAPHQAASSTQSSIVAVVEGGFRETAHWEAAQDRSHQALDRRIDREEVDEKASQEPVFPEVHSEDLSCVFQRLTEHGMEGREAAVAAKRFAAPLLELSQMGFDDWIVAIPLLEKYNGRLLRVVNALSERTEQSPSYPAQRASSPVAPAQLSTALPKELVTAEFKKLVAGGMSATDAALKAIEMVRTNVADSMPEPATVSRSDGAHDSDASYGQQMSELASMGFTNAAKNHTLLQKHAGRMERTIDAYLAGA